MIKLVYLSILLSVITSCSSSKFLEKGTSHLGKTEWKIDGNLSSKEKSLLSEEIKSIYTFNENRNWLFFIPREYIYYKNSAIGDTSWYKNSVRKYIAEPPVIYNEAKVELNRESIEKYLINKKGFFNATVSYTKEENTKKKKVYITYQIELNDQYTIHKLDYSSEDKKLLALVEKENVNALIKVGDPIDENTFELEKLRISNLLQNSGYANFNAKFIQVKGDSTDVKNGVDILMLINTPIDQSSHSIYTIGNINVHIDYNQTEVVSEEEPLIIEGIRYFKKGDKFLVKPKQMNSFIYMQPEEQYDKSKKQQTYRKLSQLSPYQFVNLNSNIDKENKKINIDIYLTPYSKKWANQVGGDIFYSNSQNSRLGVSANKEFIHRNTFRGAERFFLNLDASLEFQYNDGEWALNQDINIQNKTEIPKLIDITGEFNLLKKIGFISENRFKSIVEETNTELKAGYNFENQLNFRRSHKFNLSTGYNYQPTINKRWYYEPISFTVYNSFPYAQWQAVLDNKPLLKRTYANTFISGLIFSNLSYSYNKSLSNNKYYYFFGRLEFSGVENFLYNQISNAIDQNNTPWNSINGLDFSRFAKVDFEFRYSQSMSKKLIFASRVRTGIGSPFGNSLTIPFLKQFYVGGPNSIRAWTERELGPGGFSDLLINPDPGVNNFYQSGDIVMEANLEFRYDLLDLRAFRLELATFIDVGNIWLLEEDTDRPNSKFTNNFYNQLAVGVGYGIRFDLDFFLLRFDFGYKLRNPYPDPDSGYYWDTTNPNIGNIQFAINHPF